MSRDTGSQRRFNEQQIGTLIQRATELHEAASGVSERSLTLAEIEHIAAELGLPAEHVRTAALEQEVRVPSSPLTKLLGGPFKANHAWVTGGEMTQAQWEEVVMALRSATNKRGRIDALGQIREWSYFIGEGADGINFHKMQVALRPSEGQTAIQIQKSFGSLALAYGVPLIFLAFFFVVFASENSPPGLESFALAGMILLSVFAATRAFVAGRSRRHREQVEKLVGRLGTILPDAPLEVVPSAAAPSAAAPSEVALEGPATLPEAARIELPDPAEALAEAAVRTPSRPENRSKG